MKRIVAYLKAHRREKIDKLSLLMVVTSAFGVLFYLQQDDSAGRGMAVVWSASLLLYLYQMFFVTPGEKKIDYAAESAQAEADLTAALTACDDAALRKIIDDPLRGEAIKARAKALLAEREQEGRSAFPPAD